MLTSSRSASSTGLRLGIASGDGWPWQKAASAPPAATAQITITATWECAKTKGEKKRGCEVRRLAMTDKKYPKNAQHKKKKTYLQQPRP